MKHFRLSMIIIMCLLLGTWFNGTAQNDLDYLRSLYGEDSVRLFIKRAYTDTMVYPVSETEFNNIRSKTVGETFRDPNFGREWTFMYNGGTKIMNSERNAWNSDSSLIALNIADYQGYYDFALFNGNDASYIKTVRCTKLYADISPLRWMPNDPNKMFFFYGNTMYTFDVQTLNVAIYETFASFNLTASDIAGGDGNDVAPNGDLLIGNKGPGCFIYNIIDKKIVRHTAGNRVLLDPSQSFTTFNLGAIDYATSFSGFIIELDEDAGGTVIRDYNGNSIQEIYRRTPHFDPTYFKHNDILYPGFMVRYNDADASYYNGLGYPSISGSAYFHGWNPSDPSQFVRFEMDSWPSLVLASGGQHSCNRFGGTTGIICQHGPAENNLTPWDQRYGECYEHAYYSEDASMARRFAHHYIGYDAAYPSSSYQPEGWISPNGDFAIIKTQWGWYKVTMGTRMSKTEVDSYLGNTPINQYSLTLSTSGTGTISTNPSGTIFNEGTQVTLTATPGIGYQFDNWSGDLTGSTNPVTISMNSDQSIAANFSAMDPSNDSIYQAEEATLFNATIETIHAGYTGTGFVDYKNEIGSCIEWAVSVPSQGDYDVSIRYASGSINNRPMQIDVNGAQELSSVDFQPTGAWDSWADQSFTVHLNEGFNLIKATGITTEGGPNVDKLEIATNNQVYYSLTTNIIGSGTLTINPTGGSYIPGTQVTVTAVPDTGYVFDGWSEDATGTMNPIVITMDTTKSITATFFEIPVTNDSVYQAEDATLYNAFVQTIHAGYTGTGFVDYVNEIGSYIEWTVNVDNAGDYEVTVRYAHGSTNNRAMQIDVNSTMAISNVDFLPTGAWDVWADQAFTVSLNQGTNTIKALAITSDGGPNVDKIEISEITTEFYSLSTNIFGNGTIDLNPAGGNYEEGTMVTITAIPNTGNQFDNWSGDTTGTSNPVSIIMNENITVSANFSVIYHSINVSVTGNGNYELIPAGGTYPEGSNVTLVAMPGTDALFNGWSGDINESNDTAIVTVDMDKNITASFIDSWIELTYDDFESGWGNYSHGSNTSLYTDGIYAHQGDTAANLEDDRGDGSSIFLTDSIDIHNPDYIQLKIEFWFYAVSMDPGEDFWVQYFDGSQWIVVDTFMVDVDFVNDQFYFVSLVLDESEYTFPNNMNVKFTCDASGGADDIYLDEIRISAKANPLKSAYSIISSSIETNVQNEPSFKIYPNPFTDQLFINFELESPQVLIIDLVSIDGRVIQRVENITFNEGMHNYSLTTNSTDLKKGMYFLRIRNNNFNKTFRVNHF